MTTEAESVNNSSGDPVTWTRIEGNQGFAGSLNKENDGTYPDSGRQWSESSGPTTYTGRLEALEKGGWDDYVLHSRKYNNVLPLDQMHSRLQFISERAGMDMGAISGPRDWKEQGDIAAMREKYPQSSDVELYEAIRDGLNKFEGILSDAEALLAQHQRRERMFEGHPNGTDLLVGQSKEDMVYMAARNLQEALKGLKSIQNSEITAMRIVVSEEGVRKIEEHIEVAHKAHQKIVLAQEYHTRAKQLIEGDDKYRDLVDPSRKVGMAISGIIACVSAVTTYMLVSSKLMEPGVQLTGESHVIAGLYAAVGGELSFLVTQFSLHKLYMHELFGKFPEYAMLKDAVDDFELFLTNAQRKPRFQHSQSG